MRMFPTIAVTIPIKDDHAPTDEQAKQFVDVISDPANWPVLVHCKGGEGRAGAMAAVTRHSFDAWDHERIMKEVGNFKMKHLGFIKMPMAGCQQDFIKHWEDTPAVALRQAVVAVKTADAAPRDAATAKP